METELKKRASEKLRTAALQKMKIAAQTGQLRQHKLDYYDRMLRGRVAGQMRKIAERYHKTLKIEIPGESTAQSGDTRRGAGLTATKQQLLLLST